MSFIRRFLVAVGGGVEPPRGG